ncbi:MAG: molybdopterin-guanine dinucleotide biosynthesis protein B [Rhodobacteraceae bacterium]|nr:molybdopterin-guanine dinucleotide biosynthesis protein B [Paracoccaceae bacterium]
MKVLGIAGWKNSGKTSLVERLIRELNHRGVQVSTVKHAHHAFTVDQQGTDSARHQAAGASEVLIASGQHWALISRHPSPDLPELVTRLSPVDLVLVEGFKSEPIPKIELRRREAGGSPMYPGDSRIVAIASDHPIADQDIPVFWLDDIITIADFVMSSILGR